MMPVVGILVVFLLLYSFIVNAHNNVPDKGSDEDESIDDPSYDDDDVPLIGGYWNVIDTAIGEINLIVPFLC